jgi:hypothetical protein
MVKYVIMNMVFSDETTKTFEAVDDRAAIVYFRKHYEMYTDDGGWRLSREDTPLDTLATTEGDENETEIVSYLNYA